MVIVLLGCFDQKYFGCPDNDFLNIDFFFLIAYLTKVHSELSLPVLPYQNNYLYEVWFWEIILFQTSRALKKVLSCQVHDHQET